MRTLKEIVLDILADSEIDELVHVSANHIDELCELAGLGNMSLALLELEPLQEDKDDEEQ